MNISRALLACWVIFPSCIGAAAEFGKGLCLQSETVIASCRIGGKEISFCSAQSGGYVAYRYGVKSNIELRVKFDKKYPLSRWVDLATYTTYLGFRRGRYTYSFGMPQETLGARAFLDISRDDLLVASLSCAENSFGEKGLVSDAVVEVRDDLVRSNGFVFPPKAGL